MANLRIRTRTRTDLAKAMPALQAALTPKMKALGFSLQGEWRKRAKRDTGREREAVGFQVSRKGLRLRVYNATIQAQIDENDRRAGAAMPPWRAGSKLFRWVGRHIAIDRQNVKRTNRLAFASHLDTRKRFVAGRELRTRRQSIVARQQSITFLVARSIARRGIRGNQPALRTMAANRDLVVSTVKGVIAAWTALVNQGKLNP